MTGFTADVCVYIRSEFFVFLLQAPVVVPEDGGQGKTTDEKSLDQYFKENGDPW